MFKFFEKFMNRDAVSVETWADKNSKITSSDLLVASAIVESFTKNPTDWSEKYFYVSGEQAYTNRYSTTEPQLVSSKICVYFNTDRVKYKNSYCNVINPRKAYLKKVTTKHPDFVIATPLNETASLMIYNSWISFKKRYDATVEAANKAKREMEEDERRWNIAEELLGMKRNEQGALVPVTKVKS